MILAALAGVLAVQWAEPPAFAPGDRVRVHVIAQAELFGMPLPRWRRFRFSGTLTYYAAYDSLALQRDPLLIVVPDPDVVGFHWSEIYRIDEPNGRNWSGGALRGASMALSTSLTLAFICSVVGGNEPGADGCPFWKNFARISLVTVPVGALVGSQFTRWKPAYRRRRGR